MSLWHKKSKLLRFYKRMIVLMRRKHIYHVIFWDPRVSMDESNITLHIIMILKQKFLYNRVWKQTLHSPASFSRRAWGCSPVRIGICVIVYCFSKVINQGKDVSQAKTTSFEWDKTSAERVTSEAFPNFPSARVFAREHRTTDREYQR